MLMMIFLLFRSCTGQRVGGACSASDLVPGKDGGPARQHLPNVSYWLPILNVTFSYFLENIKNNC